MSEYLIVIANVLPGNYILMTFLAKRLDMLVSVGRIKSLIVEEMNQCINLNRKRGCSYIIFISGVLKLCFRIRSQFHL